MLLSIITVIKSPAAGFDRTYASVLREFGDSTEVEYLLKQWDPDTTWAESSEINEADHTLKIRKIRSQDRGVFDAMNQAIQAANGEWIVFLNAGDWFAKGFANSLLSQMKQHPSADYFYFDGVTVDAIDGREFFRPAPAQLTPHDFLKQAPILHPCIVMKKSSFPPEGFDLSLDLASDFALMVRLSVLDIPGIHIPKVGAFILSGGLSEQRALRARWQATRSLIHYGHSHLFSISAVCAFLRIAALHYLIVWVIRPIGPLRRWAKSRSGGSPAGKYS